MSAERAIASFAEVKRPGTPPPASRTMPLLTPRRSAWPLGRDRAKSQRNRPSFGRRCAKFADPGPNVDELGRIPRHIGRHQAQIANFGRVRSMFVPHRSKLVPDSADVGPNPVNFGRSSADVGPTFPGSVKLGSISAEAWPSSSNFSAIPAKRLRWAAGRYLPRDACSTKMRLTPNPERHPNDIQQDFGAPWGEHGGTRTEGDPEPPTGPPSTLAPRA